MLEDPLADVLLAAVALTMLVLAFEVHSLSKHSAALLPTQEHKSVEPKLSEAEEYLHWLTTGGTSQAAPGGPSESKPEEQITPAVVAEGAATAIMPRGKPEPFNPETLTGE